MLRSAGCSRGLGFVPSTYIVAHTVCNSSSKGLSALVWLPQVPGTQVVPRRICRQNTYTYKTTQRKKIYEQLEYNITPMVCKLEGRMDASSRKILKALTYNKLK